jgi:hypothetical protein
VFFSCVKQSALTSSARARGVAGTSSSETFVPMSKYLVPGKDRMSLPPTFRISLSQITCCATRWNRKLYESARETKAWSGLVVM